MIAKTKKGIVVTNATVGVARKRYKGSWDVDKVYMGGSCKVRTLSVMYWGLAIPCYGVSRPSSQNNMIYRDGIPP